jgi:GNAT superfamily N-acetyltransferase
MARQRLGDVYEDLQPLIKDHWSEIAHFKDIPLDPDWESYARLDGAGALRIFTLRDYGALKGYAFFTVAPAAHYRSSLQANADVLYLDPGYRKQGLGRDFIAFCDGELRKDGVQVVSHRCSLSHSFANTLVKLHYEPVEAVFVRRLDR